FPLLPTPHSLFPIPHSPAIELLNLAWSALFVITLTEEGQVNLPFEGGFGNFIRRSIYMVEK
ncbi:hypothetical protein, partial [Nodularia sp. LEGE 04288]|uniref:hypothetical protein n=1 Tax=Nodularia sp. LEGE 04288 TaxID=1828639 RepID=UPI001D102338